MPNDPDESRPDGASLGGLDALGRPDLADAAGEVGSLACAACARSATQSEGTPKAHGTGRRLSR